MLENYFIFYTNLLIINLLGYFLFLLYISKNNFFYIKYKIFNGKRKQKITIVFTFLNYKNSKKCF